MVKDKDMVHALKLTPQQIIEVDQFIEWCGAALQAYVDSDKDYKRVTYNKELTDVIKYFYRIYVDTIDFDLVETIYFPIESLTQIVFDYYFYKNIFLTRSEK